MRCISRSSSGEPRVASRRLVTWLVVEAHELIRTQSAGGVSLAVAVAEFYFEHSGRQVFDDGAHLSAQKVPVGDIFQESDHQE
jgi:hypothetical protein